MKIETVEISACSERLLLCNGRCAFWPEQKMLIISDLHVGKTAHFRKNGIAMPRNVLEKDLARLGALLNYFDAEKLLINGDLLHAGDNSDVDFFCQWKQKLPSVEFILVEGNHDKMPAALAEKLSLNFRDKIFRAGSLTFIHEFDGNLESFQVTGHIHPGKIIHSAINSFRLPCFAVTGRQLLLPAFSEFTGLDTRNTPKDADFFALTQNAVLQI